jgi:hypothetical protein
LREKREERNPVSEIYLFAFFLHPSMLFLGEGIEEGTSVMYMMWLAMNGSWGRWEDHLV